MPDEFKPTKPRRVRLKDPAPVEAPVATETFVTPKYPEAMEEAMPRTTPTPVTLQGSAMSARTKAEIEAGRKALAKGR
jgi:hypothetical protein